MIEYEEMSKVTERVLLVGADIGTEEDFDRTMEELKSLAEAANMETVGIVTQKMEAFHKALYIGPGKVKEVKEFADTLEADLIIFEGDLSPSQLRNLQDLLEKPVMDRTNLILDIFSSRARTREAKLQVETARLKYLLPRLVGLHEALSRQGGGSGSMSNKGAGEKKLELDRRKIEHRIAELSAELEKVERDRETQRKKRTRSGIPVVALAGYTNAGKSTLMNAMVEQYVKTPEKSVLEKDMLFATLETTVRRIDDERKQPFFLADTVGFISNLPHGLVKAFRSTLEEIRNADLIIQVLDYSDENYKNQMQVTEDTLKELGARDIPVIYVYNKADRMGTELPRISGERIFMSAKQRIGIAELVEMIRQKVYSGHRTVEFLFPYDRGAAVSYLCGNAQVLRQEYSEDGVLVEANCSAADMLRFEAYINHKGEDEIGAE